MYSTIYKKEKRKKKIACLCIDTAYIIVICFYYEHLSSKNIDITLIIIPNSCY